MTPEQANAKIIEVAERSAARDAQVAEQLRTAARDLDRVSQTIEALWFQIRDHDRRIVRLETEARICDEQEREDRARDRDTVLALDRTQAKWAGAIAALVFLCGALVIPLVLRWIETALWGE